MKVIVAGTRTFDDQRLVFDMLNNLNIDVEEIVSGHCKRFVDDQEIYTPDRLGEIWAIDNNIPVRLFPANWEKYGRYAGPIRNKEMAEYADYAVIFWDGQSSGTRSMIKEMNRLKKPLMVHVYVWGKKG